MARIDLYDNTSMEYKVNGITGNILAVNKQMSVVEQVWATLQIAVEANTIGTPKVQFDLDDITQASASAQKEIEASTNVMQKAQKQAKRHGK